MKQVEKAIAIAVQAHAGQVDKAGAPYIFHPLRLMLRMTTEVEMMAAVLHDVVEDGPGWTLHRLTVEGIPADVVEIVDFLTKRPEEKNDYDAFIRRVDGNPVARRIKLADLEDNMDLRRIANPTEKDRARLEKYRRAHAFLTTPPSANTSSRDQMREDFADRLSAGNPDGQNRKVLAEVDAEPLDRKSSTSANVPTEPTSK